MELVDWNGFKTSVLITLSEPSPYCILEPLPGYLQFSQASSDHLVSHLSATNYQMSICQSGSVLFLGESHHSLFLDPTEEAASPCWGKVGTGGPQTNTASHDSFCDTLQGKVHFHGKRNAFIYLYSWFFLLFIKGCLCMITIWYILNFFCHQDALVPTTKSLITYCSTW